MEKQKVTPEMVMNYEAEALVEAIGYEIHVDDEFLDRYCGERIKKALKQMKDVKNAGRPHQDRYSTHYSFMTKAM